MDNTFTGPKLFPDHNSLPEHDVREGKFLSGSALAISDAVVEITDIALFRLKKARYISPG